MGRSRYKIHEPTHPHFITCTVLHWIPLFTRVDSVQILIDSLKHLQITDNLKVKTILDQLAFYKKAHKQETTYQVWQEGMQPKLIQSEAMMMEKINYIHNNPIKRGYVDEAKHWRYSSASEKGDRQLFFIIPPVPKLELGNEETLRKIKKERQFEH